MYPSHKPAAKLSMANHEALLKLLGEFVDSDPFAISSRVLPHCPGFSRQMANPRNQDRESASLQEASE